MWIKLKISDVCHKNVNSFFSLAIVVEEVKSTSAYRLKCLTISVMFGFQTSPVPRPRPRITTEPSPNQVSSFYGTIIAIRVRPSVEVGPFT